MRSHFPTVNSNTANHAGGGVYDNGTLDLLNCTISNNTSSQGGGGGGIYDGAGTQTVTGCTISGNMSPEFFGGGIMTGGDMTLLNSTICQNSAHDAGAGIYNRGTLTAINCTVADNSATLQAGGISSGASLTLGNTIVADNTAGGNPDFSGTVTTDLGNNLIGDTTGCSGFTAPPDLLNVNPDLGVLGNFGGPTQTIPLLPGSPAINAGNNALVPAGIETDQRGFYRFANGTTDIGAFQVQDYLVLNTADAGAGSLRTAITNANLAGASNILFATSGTITLQSALPAISQDVDMIGPGANVLTVSGNAAYQVFNVQTGATATISGLTVDDGHSSGSGGGIENDGTLSLNNCTVNENSATGNGGGIDNQGTLTLTASTVALNNSGNDGGGIGNSGTLTLVNSTIANNAAFAGQGGGIENSGTVTSINSTVAGNFSHAGGGIYAGGTVILGNTIVAGNDFTDDGSGPDFDGAVTTDSGNNLIGDTTGSSGFTQPTDVLNVDPLLSPLGFYGGPTETLALLPGSPAIDAGNNALIPAGITTDQRGLPRIVNGVVDIGAVECQGFTISVVSGNNQSVAIDTAFAASLGVLVSSSHGDPVAGGVISYSAPVSGASATLSSNTATTNAYGVASVTATANASTGSYSVTASTGGAASSTSFGLTNTAAAATKLEFVQQPTSTTYGDTISPDVTVEVEDQYGNLVNSTASITIALDTNPTSASLGGTTTVNAVAGIATFSTLTLSLVGTGYTLEATSTGLTATPESSSFNITARPITVTAAANTKTYDATTSASAVPTITSGSLVGSDTANFTEVYSTSNAGTGLTLIPSGTVDDGNGGNNYDVTFDSASTGVITAEALTITGVANTKVYNGTTSAAALPTITSGSLQGSDTADFIETYSAANVGTGLTLTPSGAVSDGNGGNNYSYTFVPVSTGVITAEALTITAVTNTKVYDATTSAAAVPEITSGSLQGDDTADFIETYDTKNVATGKTLTPSGIVNDGNDGNNYTYTFIPVSTGVITSAQLTITAVTNTKFYDGTTSAAAIPVVTGLQGTDTVTHLSETYDTSAIGTGKTLTVATYTINDGNNGNNYTVATVPNDTGVILPAAPTALAIHTQPSATAGQIFPTQPVMYVLNQDGELDTSDNTTAVTVSLKVGTGPLLGTTTVTASGGIATFTNLADDKAETIILLFTGQGLIKAQASPTTVNPAAASSFTTSAPATATAGRPFTITVTAFDPYNNVATGYRGTVYFTSSDPRASLPPSYTFTTADSGVHTFGNAVTLKTTGAQSIAVYDLSNRSIMGSTSVIVGAGSALDAAAIGGTGSAGAFVRPTDSPLPPQSKLTAARAIRLKTITTIRERRHTIAQADAARDRVLAELKGNLHAYLMAHRLAGSRLE